MDGLNNSLHPPEKTPTDPEQEDNTDDISKNLLSDNGSLSGQFTEVTGNRVIIQQRSKTIPTEDIDANSALAETGPLICDPDVLFALRHLKGMYQNMRQEQRQYRSMQRQFQVPNPNRRAALFQEGDETMCNIKQEDDTQDKLFASPPQGIKKILGMKWHTSQYFIDAGSAKRRKTNGTPSRSSVGGIPLSTPFHPEICIAQANYKTKNTAQCDLFLKRKKVTASNKPLIFQHIKDKDLEKIEFDTKPLSFYRIMTQYIGGLGMVPEDVRHKQVKDSLFTFVMQNVQYTKVNFSFFF